MLSFFVILNSFFSSVFRGKCGGVGTGANPPPQNSLSRDERKGMSCENPVKFMNRCVDN